MLYKLILNWLTKVKVNNIGWHLTSYKMATFIKSLNNFFGNFKILINYKFKLRNSLNLVIFNLKLKKS